MEENNILNSIPRLQGVQPLEGSNFKRYLNNTWKPSLVITGQEGIPDMNGGNVLRRNTTLKLSIRLPPMVDPHRAAEDITRILTENPPYGAHVSLTLMEEPGAGWNAPPYPECFLEAINSASREVFGKDTFGLGIGGSIPFVESLSSKMPSSLFLVTGVGFNSSNAHGPNESIDLAYLNKFGKCLALFLKNY